MPDAGAVVTGSPVAVAGTGRIEFVLVAVAVALGVVLLVARAVRAAAVRRRRAAGSAYFDRDAARVGRTGRGASATVPSPGPLGPSPLHGHNAAHAMAPTFSAPPSSNRTRRSAAATARAATPAPTAATHPPGRSATSPVASRTATGPLPPRPDPSHGTAGVPSGVRPAATPTRAPSMAEPPVPDEIVTSTLPPLPALRPTGPRPAALPPMPPPPGPTGGAPGAV